MKTNLITLSIYQWMTEIEPEFGAYNVLVHPNLNALTFGDLFPEFYYED